MKKIVLFLMLAFLSFETFSQVVRHRRVKITQPQSAVATDTILAWAGGTNRQVVKTNLTVSDLTGGGGGAAETGLEVLDEGNGNGWRLVGRDAANYGNIGLNAVDFSNSTAASVVNGATGESSFAGGENNRLDSEGSVAFGIENTSLEGSFSSTDFLSGIENFSYEWTFSTINVGYLNKLGTIGSTGGTNPVGWYSGTLGYFNNQYGGRGSYSFGAGLEGGAAYCTIVGSANVDLTVSAANQFWAQSNNANNPSFIVGTGTVNSSTPTAPTFGRKNGFVVWRNDTAELPNATVASIDTRGSKAVPTVEWVESHVASAGTYTQSTVSLTAAQIQNIGTTPIEVIPDPLGSNLIVVDDIIVKYDYGTSAFDPNNIDVNYISGGTLNSYGIGGSAEEVVILEPLGGLVFKDELGKGVELSGTDSVATADGELDVFVTYKVVNIGGFSGISDSRLKDNIQEVNIVGGVRFVMWDWNSEAEKLGYKGAAFGVIAQEVKEVVPHSVFKGDDGYFRVRYDVVSDYLKRKVSK